METDNKNPIAKLSDMLLSLNAYEFNLVASIIGYIIAEDQTALAQSALGNFFETLGQTLITIGAQNQYLNRNQLNPEIIEELKILTSRIINLEILINKFKDL